GEGLADLSHAGGEATAPGLPEPPRGVPRAEGRRQGPPHQQAPDRADHHREPALEGRRVPNIDRFIQAIRQFHADRLAAPSGEKLTLVTGVEKRPVSMQPVTVQQVRDLLKEILPADRESFLAGEGESAFDYASPSGPVRVTASKGSDWLRIEIAPVT